MAKDYGKRRPIRQKSNAPKQLFWMLISFLGGYLTATVFDFTSLSSWVNTTILAKHKKEKPQAQVVAKEPEIPKPKFEFYTLLAKGSSTPVSAPSPKATAPVQRKPITQPAVAVGNAAVVPTKQEAIVALKTPATVVVTESKPVTSANPGRDVYQIQIASFKRRQDAEQMKAGLTLKGFDVSVVAISQPQGNWFRVIVGPFGSKVAAEKTQLSLAQSERVKGMIRKMDA